MARNRRTVRENVMVRVEWRIAPAALATFAALAGAAVCIHGLLFDQTRVIWLGIGIIAAAVVALVVMLNLWPNDVSKDDS
jgi:Zn-dependent membrane protease YugP